MKAMIGLLSSPQGTGAVRAADAPEQCGQSEIAWQLAEYWAKRFLWLLVTVTSLWNIAMIFHRHFAMTGRLF